MVRIKYRYLLLNILYPDPQSSKATADTPDFLRFRAPTPQHVNHHSFVAYLKQHIATAFGDQGLGLCQSSLRLVYFSNATSTAILRVPRAHYQIVWAALSYMTEMPAPKDRNTRGPKCVVRIVRVSGTIRKAEEELMHRSRRDIVQAKLSGRDMQVDVLHQFTSGDDLPPPISDDPHLPSEEEDILTESDISSE